MKKLLFFTLYMLIYITPLILISIIDNPLIPTPIETLQNTFKIVPLIYKDILYTIFVSFIGLIIGLCLSFVIITLMDIFKSFEKAISPLIIISQAIPFNVISPFILVVLGTNILPKIFIISIVCFFPITLSLSSGFKNISTSLLNASELYSPNKFYTLIKIKFPLASRQLFSSLKISSIYAISSSIITEWMSGTKGIGVHILRAKRSFDNTKVFSCILIIVIISIISYLFINLLEKIFYKKIYN